MLDLPLLPVDEKWVAEYEALTAGNEWLRRKVGRDRRINEQGQYLLDNVPEVLGMDEEDLHVVDLGCGPGELLEIARHYRFKPYGVDAQSGAGGMGDDYLRVAALMCSRQAIPTYRFGYDAWLNSGFPKALTGKVALINSRGSWEQMHAALMDGTPHDQHHRADRMTWRLGPSLETYAMKEMATLRACLHPRGVLLIHGNGAVNHADYAKVLLHAANAAGLENVVANGHVFKWKVRN